MKTLGGLINVTHAKFLVSFALRCALLLCAALVLMPSFAQSHPQSCLDAASSGNFPFRAVSEKLSVWQSPDKNINTPAQALRQLLDYGKSVPENFPSYGYSSETYWFHLCLKNSSSTDLQRFLQIDFSHLDMVAFHLALSDSSWDLDASPDTLAENLKFEAFQLGRKHFDTSSQKELNLNPIQSIHIPANRSVQVVIEVKSQDNIMLPMTLLDQNSLEYFQEWRERSLFLYLGCVGSVLAMALSMYLISKQRLFLYQSWVILLLNIVGFLALRGYGVLLNIPQFFLLERTFSLSAYLVGTCFFIFMVRESIFEATDQVKKDPFLKKFALAFALFSPFTWILPFAVGAVIGELGILSCGVVMSFKVVPILKTFRRDAILFYAGFTSLFAVLLYFILQDFGVIAGPYPGDQVMLVSFAFNGVMLTATLFVQLHSLLTKYRLATFDLQTLLSEQYIRMAFVAHEIRNPLAVALSWLDIMHKNPDLAPKGRLKMHRNLMQINSLVSDLQDAQKTESSKLDLEMEELDFISFLEECLQDHRTLAEEKGIQLRTSNFNLKVKVLADPLRMHQVINNILSNSIKFTQKGGKLEIHPVVLDSEILEIRISDNGRGMSQQFLKMATTRFSQENPHLEKGVRPGLGLGLFLSRKIMEAHGGSLLVESPGTGLGTLVRLRVPLVSSTHPHFAHKVIQQAHSTVLQ
jgi:signal transduction histidine kinase